MNYIEGSKGPNTLEERYAAKENIKPWGQRIRDYLGFATCILLPGSILGVAIKGEIASHYEQVEVERTKEVIPKVLDKAAGLDGILEDSEKANLLRELGLPAGIEEGERIEFIEKGNTAKIYAGGNLLGTVSRSDLEEYLKK